MLCLQNLFVWPLCMSIAPKQMVGVFFMSAVAKNLKSDWAQLFPHEPYDDCLDYDDFKLAVEDALKQGVDLIVTISPTQMRACLRQALAHPQCAFINCSVSLSHSAVRTFSGRLYEAKISSWCIGGNAGSKSSDWLCCRLSGIWQRRRN